MRMAAVFTLSVSTVGLRTSGLPRWVSCLGYLVALTLLLAAGEHKWSSYCSERGSCWSAW